MKSNIKKMYVYQFLTGLHLITGVLVPFFIEEGGMNFTWVMELQAWFWFWQCAFEVPTGIIADVWGRKRSIVAGSFMFLCGIVAYISIPHWLMFFLGSFFWALGLALVSGADESLLYDSLVADDREHESKKIINNFDGLHRLGWAIGAPLASFIGYTFGLKEVIYCMAIPFSLALCVAFSFKEPPRRQALYRETFWSAWNTIRSTRALRMITANNILVASALVTSLWLHQQLLGEFEVPIVWFGWIQTGFMGVVALILLGGCIAALEKISGSRHGYLFMSASVSAIGISALGFITSPALAIILAIGVIGFGLARNAPLTNYFNKYVDSHERATAASLRNAFQSLAATCFNFVVGIIAVWSLPYSFLFLGVAIGFVVLFCPLKEEYLIG